MGLFHLNPATGNVAPCRAKVKPCPLGGIRGTENHFSTPEEAAAAYEDQQLSSLLNTLSKAQDEEEWATVKEVFETHKREKTSFSGMEISKRAKAVAKTVDKLLKEGEATDKRYASEDAVGGLRFTPERQAEHLKIVEDLMEKYEHVPQEGRMLFAGGLGGAGKSTVLKDYAGITPGTYATVNPDDIKEELCKRGLVPEHEGLTPLECAPLIHEESSHVSKILAARLMAQHKNILHDVTMASFSSVKSKVEEARAAGYGEVEAIFVDIELETSKKRAQERYRLGMEATVTGRSSLGGRILPEAVIEKQRTVGGKYKSKNAEVVVAAYSLGLFSGEPRVFDNNRDGEDPKPIPWSVFQA